MGAGKVRSKLVNSQVAHSTTTLTADRHHSLAVPSHHSLDNAADTQKLVFISNGVFENVLRAVVHALESHGATQQRHEGVLLELVVEDRHCAVTFNANRPTLLCVLDRNVERSTGSSTGDSGNTQSTRKEAFGDLEETSLNAFDVTREYALFIDVTIPVHHIDSGNADILELESGVIDSVQAEFNTHIIYLHSGKHLEVGIADRNHEGIYSFILAFYDSLSEDKSVVGVLESV